MFNFFLSDAECFDIIDSNLVIASFKGKVLLGKTTGVMENKEYFLKHGTIKFDQASFPFLARALKEAKQCYESGDDTKSFTMDLRAKDSNTLYKVVASFNPTEQSLKPMLTILYHWNWSMDQWFDKYVKMGKAQEMSPDTEPWVTTKMSCLITKESLDAILLVIEKHMQATYIDISRYLLPTKLPDFIKFGWQEMGQEVEQQLLNYGMTKVKPKTRFLEKVIGAMVEKKLDDHLILQRLRNEMEGKVPLVFALFTLHCH